jgi:hypothetical protein
MKAGPLELGFMALMLASGVLTALAVLRWPALKGALVPPFAWPLFVALAFDLATRPWTKPNQIALLDMGTRLTGVISAAVLYTLIVTFAATA